MLTDYLTDWSGADWRREAADWIGEVLAEHGLTQTGAIGQPLIRFWSTHLTVPTDQGQLWFKENNPGQRAEAAVVTQLARFVPDHVVVPLATETTRGWLLSPDHGHTLATLHSTDEVLWARVLSEYADLQRRVCEHGADLLAAGLSTLFPGDVADFVTASVAALRQLPADDPRRLDADLTEQILAALPRLRDQVSILDAGPIPCSLEHNDLHNNNVFIPRADESTLRFFDFGDAVWAHPFSSLLVPLIVLTQEWQVEPTDRRVRYVVDAYLEVWGGLASRAELLELVNAALHFAPVHRFASWHRILPCADRAPLAEHGAKLALWLSRFAGPALASFAGPALAIRGGDAGIPDARTPTQRPAPRAQ